MILWGKITETHTHLIAKYQPLTQMRRKVHSKFGRNPYFERRKGAQLCSPSDIKQVEDALKAIGHEELKFDAYVEKLNWND